MRQWHIWNLITRTTFRGGLGRERECVLGHIEGHAAQLRHATVSFERTKHIFTLYHHDINTNHYILIFHYLYHFNLVSESCTRMDYCLCVYLHLEQGSEF